MAAKTTDWRPGPTVCRCCLSEGCYKDISTEYFWMGKREVYAEMLSETLNLSVSVISVWSYHGDHFIVGDGFVIDGGVVETCAALLRLRELRALVLVGLYKSILPRAAEARHLLSIMFLCWLRHLRFDEMNQNLGQVLLRTWRNTMNDNVYPSLHEQLFSIVFFLLGPSKCMLFEPWYYTISCLFSFSSQQNSSNFIIILFLV